MNAWSHGLKGVTIFRDGCKRVAILTDSKNTKKEEEDNKETSKELARCRIQVC